MVYNKGVQKSQKGANANLTFFQNGKNEPKMPFFGPRTNPVIY